VECNARNAQRATVPDIAQNPERYLSRCVVVDGVMHGLYLFESVDGVYLEPPDSLNPSSSGFRIGLDHLSRFTEDYEHVSITGRVQDCEGVSAGVQSGHDELLFITGYCYFFIGAYVWIHDLDRWRGAPFERRMGSYERADYGDLVPAPADWRHRATVEALARQFLDALRKGDRERLAGLHFRDVGLNWKDDEAALLKFLLARDSPFAAIRSAEEPLEQLILVARSAFEPGADADNYSSVVCFCREESCAGRWPIATFDADNVRTRPYVCTDVHPYIIYGSPRLVPHFTTALGTGGLAEPRRD
jgi:hypothetical protein